MGNAFFQFKQFRIEQELCAMKVCTDACIQGAFAAERAGDFPKTGLHILDIGTGTGLLTLMLAQKLPAASFDTIEINDDAYLQSKKNFAVSPWPGRIRTFKGDIRRHSFTKKFDLIICNPPFYEKGLKSLSAFRNQAMHATHLNPDDLLQALENNLSEKGHACIMYPVAEAESFIKKAALFHFYPLEILKVKQSPKHDPFRSIICFRKKQQSILSEELCIRDDNGNYTPAFISLLKPFYLHL